MEGKPEEGSIDFVNPITAEVTKVPMSRVWKNRDGSTEILPEGETVQDRITMLNAVKALGGSELNSSEVAFERSKKGDSLWAIVDDDPELLVFTLKFAGFGQDGVGNSSEFQELKGKYRKHFRENMGETRDNFHKQNLKKIIEGILNGIEDGTIKPREDNELYGGKMKFAGKYDGFWARMRLATQVTGLDGEGKFIFWGSRNENGEVDDSAYQRVRSDLEKDGVDVEAIDRLRTSYVVERGDRGIEFFNGNKMGRKTVL